MRIFLACVAMLVATLLIFLSIRQIVDQRENKKAYALQSEILEEIRSWLNDPDAAPLPLRSLANMEWEVACADDNEYSSGTNLLRVHMAINPAELHLYSIAEDHFSGDGDYRLALLSRKQKVIVTLPMTVEFGKEVARVALGNLKDCPNLREQVFVKTARLADQLPQLYVENHK